MQTIGDRIKQFREAKGWTQDDLADAAAIHRVTIAKYEANKVIPKSTSLGRMAAALEVDAGCLLGESRDMSAEEKAVWDLREQVRRDPERQYLFNLARDADISDVRQAVAIIDALKNTGRG